MKKWFFGDKKKKATNNTAENSNTVNSSSERAPIPAHDPRHPIVQSKGLKIEDITCSIKSNDDDHHKKDSRKGFIVNIMKIFIHACMSSGIYIFVVFEIRRGIAI